MRSNTANPDPFRKFLLVALATGVVLLMLPIAAGALSCAMPVNTLAEAYDEADSIIIGLVTDCAEPVSSDPWTGGGAGCSFDTLEVLKAAVPARDYRGTADSEACGLSLQVGNQYLLFLDEDNRPLPFSTGLNGDSNRAALPREQVRILRQFRDGAVADLSDPWIFYEQDGTCTISHAVGGYQIAFSQRKVAAEPSGNDFTRDVVDGKTVLTGKAVVTGEMPHGDQPDVTIVMPADTPEFPLDGLMLDVAFLEPPVPERRAVLTAGSATWPLYRMEISIAFGNGRAHRMVTYHVGGEAAEEILSAMLEPTDVTIAATLVAPPSSVAEPQSGQATLRVAPGGNAVFSPTPHGTYLMRPHLSTDPAQSTPRQRHVEPAKPVIRFETRSTQLRAAIDEFRACAGDYE